MTAATFYLDAKGRTAINHDPGATLDYTFDWTEFLASSGDAVAGASATCSGATVVGSPVVSGQKVTVWVSGGTAGTTATLTVTITTDSSPARIEPVSVQLKITPKVA